MMLLQLAKRILPFFTAAQHNRRRCSSNTNPNFSMVDYFIASFGFSPDKAAKVSKPISYLKSPEKPDAVLRFFNRHGFPEADIKSLITFRPTILCTSPEKTLEPNLCALRNMGLSIPAIIKIVLSSPAALQCDRSLTMPRIKFWMDFLGGNETALVRVFKHNRGLVNHDISRLIAPRISLLQSYGLSAKDIQRVVCRPQIITRNIGMLEDLLNRAMGLSFQPASGMFVIGLEVMGCATREALQKKMDLLKSFGWSEQEFLSALQKKPGILRLSEEYLQVTMSFLLGEAKCDILYITSHPQLLMYSLTERLSPRVCVLQLLESKGLSIPRHGFYTAMHINNSKFVERYILPYKEEIPELCGICLADVA